ncbi:MAG: AEC family transporter [Pseudomonadota bacterium]
MSAVIAVVLPIFGLILAGWATRRLGVLGPAATGELNRFVVYLALPALLFDLVATADWADIWHPRFLAAFGIGAAAVFGGTVAWSVLAGRRPLPDAAIDGLNAGYPNTGYIGFPLVLAALGKNALVTALLATIVTGCLLFALAIVLVEIGLQSKTDPRRMAGKLALTLARNPLLVAPIVGAVYAATGLGLPTSVLTFLKMLGGSASPCALIALGLFLGEKREGARVRHGPVVVLAGLKLFVQPGLTWVLAALVFKQPPLLVNGAVLLAALPTGTGAFMLAEFYRRDADLTARVVLVSTIASVATISAYLAWAG